MRPIPAAMFPQDIIIRKRDGGTLTRDEIDFFVRGVVGGTFADYQAAALLMAIFWRGMTLEETACLTDAMMRSGTILDLSGIPGAKVDKHSTGGVGDKVSLVLAPLAAACGLKVPMMSGRGLGHTGGTLDKLEAIPGFRVMLSAAEFRDIVGRVGAAMIGQTEDIVPADRKLYALRDVTGTVESIPLICASIMSKKLAEGVDSLVLDVKFGAGAFMKDRARAMTLAKMMVSIGRVSGKGVRALLTRMDQPLGRAIGHTTEVIESIECLRGRGPADLMEVTLALGSQMLLLGGIEKVESAARERLERAIADGSALARFRALCEAQGGDARFIDDPGRLPTAAERIDIRAADGASGFINGVDAFKVAQAVILLGGGRAAVTDRIDPAVGIANLVKIGTEAGRGDVLCTIHANDRTKATQAEAILRDAIHFSAEKPAISPLIDSVVSSD